MKKKKADNEIQKLMLKTFNKKEIQRATQLFEKIKKENPWKKIEFEVLGLAMAQSRARHANISCNDGRNIPVTYDQPNMRQWKIELKKIVNEKLPKSFVPALGAVIIKIKIYKSMPKNTSRIRLYLGELQKIRPLTTPDFDNYCKSIMDSLKNIVWRDDSQAVTGLIEKFFSIKPRIEVKILYRQNKY